MTIEHTIKKYAGQVGFDLCGITTAEPFFHLEEILRKRVHAGNHSEFENLDFAKRVNPRQISPQANSIIALGKAYPGCEKGKGGGSGFIARCGHGVDYHSDFHDKMNQLSYFLKAEFFLTPLAAMVDTGPLIDRAIAARAGLGWYGKNCAIISPEYGSWIALGQILLQEKLAPDSPQKEQCELCDRCIKACPTGALSAPYQVNAAICLSQLTQTKSIIPKKYRSLLGTRLYGCDTCQEVCPHNRDKNLLGTGEGEAIDLISLLRMSKADFQKAYGNKAFGWRGKNILQRNAIIALGNLKATYAVDELIRILHGPNTMLRGYSGWALGQIGSRPAKEALKFALMTEKDLWVKQEIETALNE